MGKTRVFELAKQMGLESKELLEKLEAAGISVANHMSVLEEGDLKKFEAANAPVVAQIEEERVKPGIIRRRRREVPVESVEETEAVAESGAVAQPKSETPAAPAEPQETPASQPSEKAPEETPSAAKIAAPEAAPPAEPEPVPVTPPAEEKEAPAEKIVAEDKEVSAPPVAAKPAARPERREEKPTPGRAKVLGRVDLSRLSSGPPARSEEPQRRERPAARREAPPGRPAGAGRPAPTGRPAPNGRPAPEGRPAPAGRPATAGRGRPSFTPAPAPDEVFTPKEVRGGKKNKKGRGGYDAPGGEVADGRPGRKGRNLEVFEPDRSGRMRRPKKGAKQAKKTEVTISKAIKRVIRITDSITVGELAKRMGIKANELIRELMQQGSMVTINHPLDFDTAALLASEYNYEVENVAFDEATILEEVPVIKEGEEAPEDLRPRPPVVTVMGHVDHGKTSLLDAIRAANVTAGEAGGITQHIGAYYVELEGRKITFLDTPGHEAFTAMRARGAKATDIVILVVAADDGVMPQTREAINHAKAADVPIVVAINKIDKPDSNPERVKQELTEFGLVPEDWGGETIFAEVSAKQHINIDQLLEMVLLQAEVLELKANPGKRGRGIIVEARLDKGRGPVATVLVQEGTLHIGDPIVSGVHFGRVRSMVDDRGNRVDEAGPSMPVEVTGLSGVPDAGDLLYAVEDEKKAKDVAQHRQQKLREAELAKTSKISLDQLFAKIQEGDVKELKVVIKGDVQGSVEAVKDALVKLSTDACRLVVIHTGVGGIIESDINLASASDAVVLGFNVRPEPKAAQLAESEGVDIRLYNIIYDAVADIKNAMEGLLAPTLKEKDLGRAEVRETFSVPKVGIIAGCYVLDGKILRNAKARLVRDSVVVWEGKLSSLRRFKDDVREVAAGYECGISLENFNDLKVGDIIEAYEMEAFKTLL
ncbi:translation initiation factor IF-2 [Geoalkalibacter halelectricus]|uniref:Translation initiation factor IF-2 n=1 Tax=Geoalkalibacter halelectricus TaxID=2847045 RepID=A0ABY5ZUP8_9BACT|nr:translation initiation factor IF-2 [Geoalkalibacter halelectricus]MDO3376684.1 translation initiation factor IF-2 [Geoalkalibacter halelectricus]UWZ81364.1 translation initiation factor IF-2 [Geoalkalibacter halelectricus]